MARDGPKSGYTGVVPRRNKWGAESSYRGTRICLPTTERPADAARWYDRARYKLRGQCKGFNFPLSDETRTKLDAMSEPEFLAEVQVEKDKIQWARHTTGGTSKNYGVSYNCRDNTWRVNVKGRRVLGLPSEEAAAVVADKIILERDGPSAMTNAKFHSGEEGRKQAWQEHKEKCAHDIEAGIYVPGRNPKARVRKPELTAKRSSATVTKSRAEPKAGTMRKRASLDEEKGAASSSDQGEQGKSSSEGRGMANRKAGDNAKDKGGIEKPAASSGFMGGVRAHAAAPGSSCGGGIVAASLLGKERAATLKANTLGLGGQCGMGIEPAGAAALCTSSFPPAQAPSPPRAAGAAASRGHPVSPQLLFTLALRCVLSALAPTSHLPPMAPQQLTRSLLCARPLRLKADPRFWTSLRLWR